MKLILLTILAYICTLPLLHSQEEEGGVSLVLPNRNSLTFNRYTIHPAFSFVREQNKYISFYNKREWVQFDDAPLTYLASYSGRMAENIGAGLTVFQQNFGVLSNFGGILNFAYNARLGYESNLTFGMNVGVYSSNLNMGNVTTNFDDPALNNVPDNFMLTINPGINYGMGFLDIGVSVNNLTVYNFTSSSIMKDIPERGIQGHIMYTGFMDSRGFFDQAKFSALLRSEFRSEETITSAIVMLTVPKGIWGQVGYNTKFGASGGLGVNITSQIAIEYNFERALGELEAYGSSHDITLAYRFRNRENYDYSGDEEISGLIDTDGSRKKRAAALNVTTERQAELQRRNEERKARIEAEREAQKEADAQAEKEAEEQAKAQAEELARLAAEQKAREEAAAEEARKLAEEKAKAEAAERARLQEEQKAKAEAEKRAREQAALIAKQEAEEQARLEAERKRIQQAEEQLRKEAAEQARLEAEQREKEKAEEQARLIEAAKAEQEVRQKALEETINNPTDDVGKELLEKTKESETLKVQQADLIERFEEIVQIKDEDLKALKEENDLSEQGVAVELRPFKSVTEENTRLRAIRDQLDQTIQARNEKIKELKEYYEENNEAGMIILDEVVLHYRNTLKRLEQEQIIAMEMRNSLDIRLEEIREATEFEKRRRIKRAAFDNEEERYRQDRATLQNIKQTTALLSNPPSTEDFDFGEERIDNIRILKNINNVESGYYLILAVHSEKDKRDEFVRQVVASGRQDVDFFYDVNTSKYYIYIQKFESIEQAANEGLKSKGTAPYNMKTSIVKIEN